MNSALLKAHSTSAIRSIGADEQTKTILPLLKAFVSVPGSTAAVERRFSTLNYFKQGSSMSMSLEGADLRLMSSNYPPASQANVREAISLWMQVEGERNNAGVFHRPISRSKEGPYYQIERIRMGLEPGLKQLVENKDSAKAQNEERKVRAKHELFGST